MHYRLSTDYWIWLAVASNMLIVLLEVLRNPYAGYGGY